MSISNKPEEEQLAKALGEPVFEDFSNNTILIRRNLLLFCSITLFYKLNDLSIAESSFLGLKFNNLTDDVLSNGLFFIVLYHFLHFAVNIPEHCCYLRLRMTRTKVKHITAGTIGDCGLDYPNDPKQSTLYNWWLQNASRFSNESDICKDLKEIQRKQYEIMEQVRNDSQNYITELNEITNKIDNIKKYLESTYKKLYNSRIKLSLERFDKWFYCYQNLQIFRWIIFEIGFPIGLGIWCFYLTCPRF